MLGAVVEIAHCGCGLRPAAGIQLSYLNDNDTRAR